MDLSKISEEWPSEIQYPPNKNHSDVELLNLRSLDGGRGIKVSAPEISATYSPIDQAVLNTSRSVEHLVLAGASETRLIWVAIIISSASLLVSILTAWTDIVDFYILLVTFFT